MTVAELITRLQELPKNAEVLKYHYEGGYSKVLAAREGYGYDNPEWEEGYWFYGKFQFTQKEEDTFTPEEVDHFPAVSVG